MAAGRTPAARIARKTSWGDYHLFRLEAAAASAEARPGRFLMIRVADGPDPLLRRPLSLHDAGDGWLEILFQVAGRGTALLARKREGESLDILGPLGRGFRLEEPWAGREAWLAGGGRGIAPLFYLGKELLRLGARVKVLYGARREADLPIRDRLAAAGLPAACSTDDGTFGYAGLVTGFLEDELRRGRPDRLFVCGPEAMMKACAAIALGRGLPAQISLESLMGCGFGACWGCVRRLKTDGRAAWGKICEDGPVFEASEIAWDEES